MYEREADWTLFWRQLAELRGRVSDGAEVDVAVVAEVMQPAFYRNAPSVVQDVTQWIKSHWLPALVSTGDDAAAASAAMKQASPKYVPREWMLVTAYKAADAGDYGPLRTLHQLFKTPCVLSPLFDLHPTFAESLPWQVRRAPRARRQLLHACSRRIS
jgi:uncharacterized protein YdiU (UPF0061 family)